MFQSIRWRLPLSYAVVALLVTLSLGSMMLLILSRYYAIQEKQYLVSSGEAFSGAIDKTLESEQLRPSLQTQIEGLSFLSRTQIRVLDSSGKVLADTGIPSQSKSLLVSSAPAGATFYIGSANPSAVPGKAPEIIVRGSGIPVPGPTQMSPGPKTPNSSQTVAVIRANDSIFGYKFAVQGGFSPSPRSSQLVALPLPGGTGTLEISRGPAFGTDILRSVGVAWAFASLFAVALAGVAGWWASRQVTAPLSALTSTTHLMEEGDLSARVHLTNRPASEFRALSQAFNGMAGQVEDTVSSLRSFVAVAAHELHTPLTALHTNLELASGEKNSAKRAEFLSRAQGQEQRLEELVNNLLDLSRLEAAGSGQPRELFDLSGLLAQQAELFASRAEQTERDFRVNLPASQVLITGSPRQIERAISNLLDNAFKFTEMGGVITLSLDQLEGQAKVTVTDDGIGIPAEDLPLIFSRFHRGQNTSHLPGSGLGLAIVGAIASSHGGYADVVSDGVGHGSRFSFSVPISRVDD